MKLRSTAADLPPLSLPKKVQLLRLCPIVHNRNYVLPVIMCSPPVCRPRPLAGTNRELHIISTGLARIRADRRAAGIELVSIWEQ
jgi:hypothetical protein